ncbi:hypothetical protein HGA13_17135 [Nocardia speluncae]|uniref:Uncharacterized protein n=1 Tax=Nocardia speluncae TaxID=419477 RepID=A0A846XJH5_9NOCA|nr:hypothetical protein [Nocardia speluncae]NKY34786.1 hypothetical protein [Nocardia speluncae]
MGLGEFFGNNWDELVVGAASVAGFALGGPPLAIVLGGAAGGITSAAQGENFFLGAGFGAAGAFGGGVFSLGVGGALRRAGVNTLARNGGLWGAVPRALGGGHLAAWRTYMGLLGSFTAGWSADSTRDTVYKYLGSPAIPLIDISVEELSEIPDAMPHVYMPDAARLPEGLEFTAPMQKNFRTLPEVELDCWTSFGKKPSEPAPVPEESDVSDIFGAEGAGMPEYAQRVEVLRDRYRTIRSRTGVVAEAVERSAQLCHAGRKDLGASITKQKEYVATDPRDMQKLTELLAGNEKPSEYSGVSVFYVDPLQLSSAVHSEDLYTMVVLESSYASVETIMAYYAEQFAAAAAALEGRTTPKDSDSDSDSEDRKSNGSGHERSQGPRRRGADPARGRPDLTGQGEVAAPEPLDLGTDADTGREPDGDSVSAGGRTEPEIASAVPPAGQVVPPAVNSGSARSAMGAMLLPQLMQAVLSRRNTNNGDEKAGRRNEHEDTATGFRPEPVPAPGAGPPPARQTPGHGATQPTGSPAKAETVTGTPAPPRGRPAVASSSENVVYTFPDGRTQEVSAVVARALDTAFGNAAGTDARAAYAGTPAGWTDEKKIGARVDPYRLMTGDVGVWTERTALLVVFEGPDPSGGTIEGVIDGALVPITSLAEMRNKAGEFGPFTGFFHPPGIEMTTPAPAGAVDDVAGVDRAAAAAAVPM